MSSNKIYSQTLLLDKFTEGINPIMYLTSELDLLMFENIRFIVIQMIIVSLQLLNRV
jgi:hypothetical protein